MKELLEFHEQFYASLIHSGEIEELADCFVNNSAQISDLYVDYCKGKEKSQQIIEEKSAGYFTKIHKVHYKVFFPEKYDIFRMKIWISQFKAVLSGQFK